MKLLLVITIIFNFTLLARENPFEPKTSNSTTTQHIDTLKKALKKAPVLFEKPKPKPVVQKIIQKPIVKPQQTKKIAKIKPKKDIQQKLVYSNKFAKIQLLGNSIKVITKDNLLRDFMQRSPKQLVLDFERFDVIKQSSKKVYSKSIKSLMVGYHGYYYRFIFLLSSKKSYKIEQTTYGYLITLH